LESYKSDLTSQYAPVVSYNSNKGSFPASYVGVPLTTLQQKLAEVQNSMNNATGTTFSKLFNEQTNIQSAINYDNALSKLNALGYKTDEQIMTAYDQYNKNVSSINDEIKQVLQAIYQVAPYSTVAVSKLYSIDPSNKTVALSYFEDQYKLLQPIISNAQTYQMYSS
jgi:hypothetical protein